MEKSSGSDERIQGNSHKTYSLFSSIINLSSAAGIRRKSNGPGINSGTADDQRIENVTSKVSMELSPKRSSIRNDNLAQVGRDLENQNQGRNKSTYYRSPSVPDISLLSSNTGKSTAKNLNSQNNVNSRGIRRHQARVGQSTMSLINTPSTTISTTTITTKLKPKTEDIKNKKQVQQPKKERTPNWILKIFDLAKLGRLNDLQKSLEGFDPTLIRHLADDDGNTLLHIVTFHGHLAILQWLISILGPQIIEAALNDQNSAGQTVILTALKGGQLECLKWIVRRTSCGEKAFFLTKEGVTKESLLHSAAKYGNVEVVRWLAGEINMRNMRVDLRGPGLITPLMVSAKRGRIEICHELILAGSDPLCQTELNWKASDFAIRHRRSDCLRYLLMAEASSTLASEYQTILSQLNSLRTEHVELRGHFRECLRVGKWLGKERGELIKNFSTTNLGSKMPQEEAIHLLLGGGKNGNISARFSDLEHRLGQAEEFWKKLNKNSNVNANSTSMNSSYTDDVDLRFQQINTLSPAISSPLQLLQKRLTTAASRQDKSFFSSKEIHNSNSDCCYSTASSAEGSENENENEAQNSSDYSESMQILDNQNSNLNGISILRDSPLKSPQKPELFRNSSTAPWLPESSSKESDDSLITTKTSIGLNRVNYSSYYTGNLAKGINTQYTSTSTSSNTITGSMYTNPPADLPSIDLLKITPSTDPISNNAESGHHPPDSAFISKEGQISSHLDENEEADNISSIAVLEVIEPIQSQIKCTATVGEELRPGVLPSWNPESLGGLCNIYNQVLGSPQVVEKSQKNPRKIFQENSGQNPEVIYFKPDLIQGTEGRKSFNEYNYSTNGGHGGGGSSIDSQSQSFYGEAIYQDICNSPNINYSTDRENENNVLVGKPHAGELYDFELPSTQTHPDNAGQWIKSATKSQFSVKQNNNNKPPPSFSTFKQNTPSSRILSLNPAQTLSNLEDSLKSKTNSYYNLFETKTTRVSSTTFSQFSSSTPSISTTKAGSSTNTPSPSTKLSNPAHNPILNSTTSSNSRFKLHVLPVDQENVENKPFILTENHKLNFSNLEAKYYEESIKEEEGEIINEDLSSSNPSYININDVNMMVVVNKDSSPAPDCKLQVKNPITIPPTNLPETSSDNGQHHYSGRAGAGAGAEHERDEQSLHVNNDSQNAISTSVPGISNEIKIELDDREKSEEKEGDGHKVVHDEMDNRLKSSFEKKRSPRSQEPGLTKPRFGAFIHRANHQRVSKGLRPQRPWYEIEGSDDEASLLNHTSIPTPSHTVGLQNTNFQANFNHNNNEDEESASEDDNDCSDFIV